MGSITLDAPTGTVTSVPATLDGTYVRAVPDALGILDLVQLDINDHLGGHAGESTRWTFTGPISDGLSDAFSIPLPDVGLVNGDFCWRARVRDVSGTWSDWTSRETVTLAVTAPTVSSALPSAADPTLEVMAGYRLSAAYSSATGSKPSLVYAQLVAQAGAETWDAATYSHGTMLWNYVGPARSWDGTRFEIRYSGRTLGEGVRYLWRIRAEDEYGGQSAWTGGQFSIEVRDSAIPGAVETLTDQFSVIWETGVIKAPVGIWYDPNDSANVRVLNKANRAIYRIKQSDRTIVDSKSVKSITPYGLGLSGDPADSTAFWVLDAPWAYGGATTGNRAVKIRWSDLATLADYSLPDGRLTAIKVSSSWIYVTNWDDDKIYRINKSTGATSVSFTITYGAVQQEEPTGIMVNGTTLYYFFYNGGTTRRFLLADESAYSTITDEKSTEGLSILGGEVDTDSGGQEIFGDNDDLGKVWKFTLTVPTYENGGDAGRYHPSVTSLGDA